MKFQQIRSATVIVTYADKKFLVDPWLADKGSMPAVANKYNDTPNPMVDLPMPINEIIDVDAVVVTHLHFDHFDDAAKEALPKSMPIFAQNEGEANELRGYGFEKVTVLTNDGVDFEGVTLVKTGAVHGEGEYVAETYKAMNITAEASGLILKHHNEKTAYLAGDTIWCSDVAEAINAHRPEIVVLNVGHAQLLDGSPIIMGAEDLFEVHKAAPKATIIASHMEAVNHALLTREELNAFVNEKGLSERVRIPDDGEVCTF